MLSDTVRSGVVGHGAKAGATGRVNCKGGAAFGKVSKRDTIDAAVTISFRVDEAVYWIGWTSCF